ncbi:MULTISPECIES: LysR family transcriptional regulator [Agrobacterium]|jgi:DNA-binding transcriptional LysR family regulator|uniref:HTH-type transcriptional regulator TtuA n=1 Tax=Agrobacterium tumefaciens TaxID=358 RepID=A0AAW8M282_AGRTU|nr:MULTISPECIES: LysR family transcriptional regulator [Agrobacterium]MBP2511456.1 DNA-binding transcriptional LysR family regulator [Agrobacterium tumefaciens]MBP2519281.1 DNA-binding transcriptional LysR family regulator [Agrobacterium tumefaciens]MBP2537348.1 DNA-binding transcriptional LysR family regulator [Agrobacterium tumefaciens]MBP2542606.1 DNA-binding transcriptional LysR family regulator [Agrobacterium tumefaciens]MBP2568607.1 DNA-binding transcriptional LysR family regulator [Agro
MDYLAAMRVFVRVVERENMSAAARDLGIGQPAVSERIDRLETHLGTRLLQRNTRRVSVTQAGHIFYERCKLAIEATENALASLDDPASVHGTLKIAAPHGLGEVVVAPLLQRLRERHPRLMAELILNDRMVDPVTEGVDISLRLGTLGEGSFTARKLGQIGRRLVASPAYLERHGEPDIPADLGRHPFLRVAGLFNDGRMVLTAGNKRQVTVRVETAIVVSNWRPLRRLLLDGAGIGVLQDIVCADAISEGTLKQILLDFTLASFDLYVLYSPKKSIAPSVRAALTLLDEILPSALTQGHPSA